MKITNVRHTPSEARFYINEIANSHNKYVTSRINNIVVELSKSGVETFKTSSIIELLLNLQENFVLDLEE